MMYKYRNKKTGQVIVTACQCAGNQWEEVPEMGTSKPSAGGRKRAVKNEREKDISDNR